MTLCKSPCFSLLGLIAIVLSFSGAKAQTVNSTGLVRSSVPAQARVATDGGALDSSKTLKNMQLLLLPSAGQQQALHQLLSDQRTPGTANYHKWLTPEQFGEQFGVSVADEAKVRAWLASQGFTNIRTSNSRTAISFDGTAGLASQAFNTEIHALSLNGETHFSNVRNITLPAHLSGVVKSVRGLDNFKPKARAVRLSHKALPQYTYGSGGYVIAPGDIATMYDIQNLYNSGIDGSGVTVAVVGQTDIDMTDISAFQNGFGIGPNLPTVVLVAGSADPGTNASDQFEASLDLEQVSAVARGSNIVYVNSTDVYTSLAYAIDQNLAQVISISYGTCEPAMAQSPDLYWYELLAQQANAQGITLVGPTGDTGAADCDLEQERSATDGLAVDFPAVLPEFTAVGGTSLVYPNSSYFSSTTGLNGGSALSYIPEVSWNDTATQLHLEAGGGGVSMVFAKPGWQQGQGVPSDGFRDVPDISFFSLDAYTGPAYIICSGGSCASGPPNGYTSGEQGGGTSASTPLMAGVVALINNYLVAGGQLTAPGLGNINPQLYLMAKNTADVFHDVTSGNNIVPCTIGTTNCTTGSFGYNAGTGYDQVTGWGSIDVYNLAREWSNNTVNGSTLTLTSSSAAVNSGDSVTFTAIVAPVTGSVVPSGTVSFYADSVLLGSSQLDAGGVATFSTTLAEGGHKIAASYGGSLEIGESTSQYLSLTVLTPTTTTITSGTTTTWVQGVSLGFSIQVLPASGTTAITGTVNVYVGSTLLGSTTVNQGSGVFNTTALPVGTDSVTAEFVGNSLFEPSTSSAATITIKSANPIGTSTTLAPSATSIAGGGSVTLVVNVTPASGTTSPSGTVTFFDGSTQLGTGSLSNGATSITASSLSAGTHQLTASYGGNTSFSGSSSAVVVVTVAAATPVSTTTTLTASSTKVAQGAAVTLTATVNPGSGSTPLTGTVNFYTGTTLLGSVQLSNGTASLSTTALPVGTDNLTAQYGGSAAFAVSTSSAISVNVVQPDFTLVASPAAVTVKGGTTATSSLVLTPSNGFSQTVSMACSGLPQGSVCTFGSGVQGTNGTVTYPLSISTTTQSSALELGGKAPLVALLPFAMLFSVKRRKALHGILGATMAIFAMVAVLGTTGCASGKTTYSSPAGGGSTGVTSSVVVTATTPQGTSHTTTIVLTVD